jgi:hypothetical protein
MLEELALTDWPARSIFNAHYWAAAAQLAGILGPGMAMAPFFGWIIMRAQPLPDLIAVELAIFTFAVGAISTGHLVGSCLVGLMAVDRSAQRDLSAARMAWTALWKIGRAHMVVGSVNVLIAIGAVQILDSYFSFPEKYTIITIFCLWGLNEMLFARTILGRTRRELRDKAAILPLEEII